MEAASEKQDNATSRPIDFYVPINITWRQTRQPQVATATTTTTTSTAPSECDSNNNQQQQHQNAGPQTRIESIAWSLVPASGLGGSGESAGSCAGSEREPTCCSLDSERESESLADIIAQLDASTSGANCMLVACGPLPLRQHLHPAALRAKVSLSPLYESYVDLSKEFARRYGHINPSSSASSAATAVAAAPATTTSHHQTQQQQQQQQVASSCQCHCCDYYAAYVAAAVNESATMAAAAGGFANQMDFYSQQQEQAHQLQQQQQPLQKEPTQRSPISSISLRVDQMLKFLSIERDDSQTPEAGEPSALTTGNAATGQPLAKQEKATSECCQLNSRVVDSMGKLVERMLSDGHQFARIERIKRRVEVGLCDHEPNEQEQRVVRARGLPWQATEQDIADFFVGLNIARGGVGLCLSRQGRRNGEALIQFESREHRNLALGRHKHFMGQRYIEVYRASGEDFLSVATGYNNKAQTFLSRGAQVIIRMRGLPFTCAAQQIVDFFSATHLLSQRNGYRNNNNNSNHLNGNKDSSAQILKGCEVLGGEEGVLFVKNHDDKPTGDAFVLFATEQFAQRALQKHHQNIGSRYVELFRSSVSEVQQVLSISMDLQSPPPPQQQQQQSGGETVKIPRSSGQQRKSQQQQQQQQQQQAPQNQPSNSWAQKLVTAVAGFTWAQVATSGAAAAAKPANELEQADQSSVAKEKEATKSESEEQQQVASPSVALFNSCGDDVNYPTLNKSGEHHQSSAQSTDSSAFDNNSIKSSSAESSSSKSQDQCHESSSSQMKQQINGEKQLETEAAAAASGDEMISSPGVGGSPSAQSPVSILSAASSYKSSQFADGSQRAGGAKNNPRSNQSAAASQQSFQHPAPQHNQHRTLNGSTPNYKGLNHHNNQPRYWQQAAAGHQQHQHPLHHQQVPAAYDPNAAHYMSANRHYGHPQQQQQQQHHHHHNHQHQAQHPQMAMHMNHMAVAAYHHHHHQAFQHQQQQQQHHHHHQSYMPQHQRAYPMPHYQYYAPQPTVLPAPPTVSMPTKSSSPNEAGQQSASYDPQFQAMDTSKRDCVRLRGLPFEAQVEDVLYFLGERGKSILYQGVHMVYSAQGQPTGEAVIQMNTCASAAAAAQEYHKKVMTVGKKQRYIEVIPSSIDEMSPMLGLGAFMSHQHRPTYMSAPMAPPMTAAGPMHLPYHPAHYPQHHQMLASSPIGGGGAYSPTAMCQANQELSENYASAGQVEEGEAKPSSAADDTGKLSGEAINSAQEVDAISTSAAPSESAKPTIKSIESSASSSTTTSSVTSSQSASDLEVYSGNSNGNEAPGKVHQVASPMAAHSNHLVPAAAAHTAAAYYPILYYYPHQQMVAPPYQ